MPKEVFGRGFQFLRREQVLTFEEITRLARIFVANGVEKIRLTGGEPLLRRHLDDLVAMLRPIDGLRDLTLTTNGSLLAEQAAGLDRRLAPAVIDHGPEDRAGDLQRLPGRARRGIGGGHSGNSGVER